MENHPRPMTLFDAWLEYETHLQATLPQKNADALLAQTRTALLRYTLPGWGFPLSKGQRLTAQEREQGLQFMNQVGLEQLTEAMNIQEKLFEQLNVAGNSQRNYRWVLNVFTDWCKQQSWSVSITRTKERRVALPENEKKEPTLVVHDTGAKTRFVYRLPEEQISASLQQELKAFRAFLTQGKFSVSEQRAQQHRDQVLRLLGWLHRVQGTSVENLSLERLVPKTTEGKELISFLVRSHLQWLYDSKLENSDSPEHALLSPYTAIRTIDTWVAVAKFVYRDEIDAIKWKNKEEIPAFRVLYAHRRMERKKLDLQQHDRRSSENVMSWPEFLEVGEVLRSECTLRFSQSTQSKKGGMTRGALRSLTAIAQSYQRFLCFALLAYIPPGRMQEIRELKVLLPAVPDREQINNNTRLRENLLYQDDDEWWIRIAARKYKSTVRPERRTLLPNIRYGEGRCFYQYLEEWMLHYEYQDDQGETLAVPGLRSCFNPQHNYFFTLKNGQPYSSASFGMLLRHTVHRITDKPFHSVRHMFVTHIRKRGDLSSIDLEKLALSMGHSSNQLETIRTFSQNPPQEDTLWAAEIAQAFIDGKQKEEVRP